ncbi:MAG TPA: efflux RND transporter periplasmic adaptor subunit [Desulfuromonadales bacterium]|nr:efflux RND transporter periplasmic adaptor subunit [Desulfuromonadales bacterium]
MSPETISKLAIDRTQATPPHKGDRNVIRYTIITLLIVVSAVTTFFFSRNRPVTVETTSVVSFYPTQAFTLLNSSGYVVAQRKAAVASKSTGRLEWIGVEEGSRVSAGQVIARLENRDLEALVRQAEAQQSSAAATREQAQAEATDAQQAFRRQQELLRQGIVSQAEHDTAEARFKRSSAAVSATEAGVRSASAGLQLSRVNLGYSMILAPFDAVVLTKNADVGDIITPLGSAANAKAAVVTIADLGSLQVEADVSESNVSLIKKGQPCEITLDALPGSRFQGRVHTIVPTADRSKASIMVKIRFLERDERVLPEMSAKVAFLEREALPADKRARIAVNPAAIVTVGGRSGVYKVVGDRAVFTPVTSGAKLGDLREVSGISSGNKVILKPLNTMKEGIKLSLPEKK